LGFFSEGILFRMVDIKVPKKINNFYCEKCEYSCSRPSYWLKHTNTQKHINATKSSLLKVTDKVTHKFNCDKCDFHCSKNKLWQQHLITKKHNSNVIHTKNTTNNNEYYCHCGKIYSHKQTLNNHKKKCNLIQNTNDVQQLTNLIYKLIENQQDLIKTIIATDKTTNNTVTITTTNSNNGHNQFNLQFFLNEQCKDAINLSEFVKNIQVTISDLEHTGEVGYANGISAIIGNALENLDVYKRPIHCSNVKHETLYIKDDDKWEKESKEREKLIGAIKEVGNKNIQQITQWQKQNPQYTDSESNTSDKYIHIVSNAMVGFETDEINNNYKKIVTNIAKKTTIDKNVTVDQDVTLV
jgi:hypothetical protein